MTLFTTLILNLALGTNAWGYRCAASGTPWFISLGKIEVIPAIEQATKTTYHPINDFTIDEALEFRKDVPTLILIKSDLQKDAKEWILYLEKATREKESFFPGAIWNSLISGQPVSKKELHFISKSKPLYLIKDEKMFGKKIVKKDGGVLFKMIEDQGHFKTWTPVNYFNLKNKYQTGRPKNPTPPASQTGATFLVVQNNKGHIVKTRTEYKINENYSEESYAEAKQKCAKALKAWELEIRGR